MRRTLVVPLLLVLFFVAVVPVAQADGLEPLIITPYRGGPEFYAAAGQEVIIRAHWLACNRGLTEAFIHAASVSMEVTLPDGSRYLTVEPPSRGYWSSPAATETPVPSECIAGGANTLWGTEWLYSLGQLQPGDYELHFVWAFDHQLADGGDWDGDGRIDKVSGVLQDRTITIHVS